jgi:hypothetical protein
MTYKALATTTLSTSTASVTFGSIPATYRDLVVVVNGKLNDAAGVEMTLNSDTTNGNYSWVDMEGTSTGAVSFTLSNRTIGYMGNEVSTLMINLMDYSVTDKHTTSLASTTIFDSSAANTFVTRAASRWANTAAVTTIKLEDTGGKTFSSGTTFALYGIEA